MHHFQTHDRLGSSAGKYYHQPTSKEGRTARTGSELAGAAPQVVEMQAQLLYSYVRCSSSWAHVAFSPLDRYPLDHRKEPPHMYSREQCTQTSKPTSTHLVGQCQDEPFVGGCATRVLCPNSPGHTQRRGTICAFPQAWAKPTKGPWAQSAHSPVPL